MGYDDNSLWDNLMNFSRNGRNEELKKLKPSDRLLAEIKSYGFDMSQLIDVLKCKGNQLTISCAGSGKTTSLVFKVIYDIKTNQATKISTVNGNQIRVLDKIWVCTFLRSGADELQASLRKWQRRLHCVDTSSAIQFSTLHAEFKRALNAMGVETNIISAKKNSSLLKDVVSKYALKNQDGRDLNAENMRDLEGALTYTRNRLDEKRYENDTYQELNIGAIIIDSILIEWKHARKQLGMCDFEDLQEMLYEECCVKNNEKVINFLSKRYNLIYIDEFQDTSQIQYELIKVYGSCAKQVMAIGDDDQTIYSWRGSCNDIIRNRFEQDFMPVRTNLSINFRCPENILEAIKPSIQNNKERFDKNLVSYKKGGEVRLGVFPNYARMVNKLGDLIYQDVKDNMSVAVLCRVNSDGLMPALIFDKLNLFSFSISGEGMTLDSYIGRTVLSIIRLMTDKSTQAVKNALNLLTYDSYSINNLMKVCKTNKLSIWTINARDLQYSCPSIASLVLDWREYRETNGEIPTLQKILEDYRLKVFNKDNQFNEVVRSVIMSVEALLTYFDYSYADEFLMELEDINERLKGRKDAKKAQIRIATVHEFKGKEADSVYVWNASRHVFPYRSAEDSVEEMEEERRIFYIANTRARKRSSIMTIKGRESMFLSEMNLEGAEDLCEDDTISGSLINKTDEALKTEANLRKFEEVGVTSDSEENEFWDLEDEEFENRYENAESDFQDRMRKR
jgi:DNA helicase-2/ATP-dependent DNA helicase PcrA